MKRKLVIFGLILTLVAIPLAACQSQSPTPAPTSAPAPQPVPTAAPKPTVAPQPTTTATASGEKFTWTYNVFSGVTTNAWPFYPIPYYQTWLNEMSGGRITLDTKIDLVPSAEVIMAVIDGRIPIGNQRVPWASGTFPQFDYLSLPFYFNDLMEMYKTVSDPDMMKLMQREYDKIGLVYIADFSFEPEGAVWARKPLKTLADFNGLKTRTSGLLQTNVLKAMGALPLTITNAELADALQRGTVDAAATSVMFGAGIGLLDVTTDVNLWLVASTFPCHLIVNKKAFNTLPADLQAVMREWGERITKAAAFGGQTHYNAVLAWLPRVGKTKVTTPDKAEVAKARAAVQPAIDAWAKTIGPVSNEILAIANRYASGK